MSKVKLFGSDGVKRVWLQPGEEYKTMCLAYSQAWGGSVMVWDCMSAAALGSYI